jgi:hypothetical protein
MISYTQYSNQFTDLTQNTSATNITRGLFLINQGLRGLTTKFYLNEVSQDIPGGTVANQVFYNLPYNIKELTNFYITIGNLRYSPTESPTTEFWDDLQFAQYSSNVPQYYFVFNKQIGIFPTPSSNGNELTVRYKHRLRDLSQADYTTGTISVTTLTNTMTGSGTSWTNDMADRWIQIPATSSNTTSGDDNWYQIFSVQSSTALTLYNQYQGNTVTGGTYTIGEMPILPEDYQIAGLYYALWVYYTSIVPNLEQGKVYKDLYDFEYEKLDAEFGNKSTKVGIARDDMEVANPNLFVRSLG